jgi:hypothetical protein
MRIRGPLTIIVYVQGRTPCKGTDKAAGTYLPQGPAPRFRHGWFNISSSPGYPHYDWVGHM